MSGHIRWVALVAAAALAVAGLSSAGEAATAPAPAQAAPVTFLETFDGKPTNPQPWNPANWDIVQTSRDPVSWANPDPVDAHHAFHNCGDVAAGGSHQIRTWAETVFKCNDHVMTSINGTPGYAAIYLSPPAMADFSNGASTVSFDVSTFVSSTRDWLDVLITPYADSMSYPFRSDLDVDGSGLPYNAIHIEQSFGSDQWEIEIIRNGAVQTLGRLAIPYSRIGGQSRVTRTPVRIQISPTSITMSYPTATPVASVTVNYARLSWTQGIVQFGHHSYVPLKDCSPTPQLICQANTWHWDNVRISPARPFYQWQATPERSGAPVTNSNVRRLQFGQAAPANARLFFSGNCGVQVRNSSTAAWRNATVTGSTPNRNVEHTQSYHVDVPAGATGIDYRFVANGWYGVGYGCSLANPIVKSLPVTGTNAPVITLDRDTGNWAARAMSDWTFRQLSAGVWTRGYDRLALGDFDRDGSRDDYVVWNRTTGRWVIHSLVNGSPVHRSSGTWTRGFDQVIAGDFDGDGFANDLLVWDNNTGSLVFLSTNAFVPTFRNRVTYSTIFDTIVVGDFDDDGRLDDLFIWDVNTGQWVMHSYSAFRYTHRGSGRWSLGYDRAYAGDFNNDGRFDDLLVWDDQTGSAVSFTWSSWTPLYRRAHRFSSTLDIGTSADLDGNGRWNEMLVFDWGARAWQVYSWVDHVPTLARAGTWPWAYDVVVG